MIKTPHNRLIRGLFTVMMSLAIISCSGENTANAASTESLVEGQDYKNVRQVEALGDGSKIVIAEVFWYGCPHCYQFEPHVQAWKMSLPADVEFIRIPAPLNRVWKFHARAYYAMEVLGVIEKVHQKLFDAIHVERNRMVDIDALAALVTRESGVPAEEFKNTFNSFSVDAKLRRSEDIVRNFGISSVPTMVVAGKYWTSTSLAGTDRQALENVNKLIEKVRSE